MERGFEQLVIIFAVIAFSLLDLLLRWLKRRAEGSSPAPPEEMTSDEFPMPYMPPPAEERPEPVWRLETLPVAYQPAPPVRSVPAPAPVPRSAVRRRFMFGPGDARRGVVLMTVLGPCRAQSDAYPPLS